MTNLSISLMSLAFLIGCNSGSPEEQHGASSDGGMGGSDGGVEEGGVPDAGAPHCSSYLDCLGAVPAVEGTCARGLCDPAGVQQTQGQPIGCYVSDAPAGTTCSTKAGCTGNCTGFGGVGCVVSEFPSDCGPCTQDADCGGGAHCKGNTCYQ